jgi:hypothetical protein
MLRYPLARNCDPVDLAGKFRCSATPIEAIIFLDRDTLYTGKIVLNKFTEEITHPFLPQVASRLAILAPAPQTPRSPPSLPLQALKYTPTPSITPI